MARPEAAEEALMAVDDLASLYAGVTHRRVTTVDLQAAKGRGE